MRDTHLLVPEEVDNARNSTADLCMHACCADSVQSVHGSTVMGLTDVGHTSSAARDVELFFVHCMRLYFALHRTATLCRCHPLPTTTVWVLPYCAGVLHDLRILRLFGIRLSLCCFYWLCCFYRVFYLLSGQFQLHLWMCHTWRSDSMLAYVHLSTIVFTFSLHYHRFLASLLEGYAQESKGASDDRYMQPQTYTHL